MRTKEIIFLVKAALIQAVSRNVHRTILTILLIAIAIIGGTVNYAGADMISMDSSFGPDTITHDTETGLKWLDVTLSTPYSYDEILVELSPGGSFVGYRLATDDEVRTFWQNAGINLQTLGTWTTDNFQPIVDLMALVGITAPEGGGVGIDYTAGHIESGPGGGSVIVANLGADHNTQNGQPFFGAVPSSNENENHGSWLVERANPNTPSTPLLLLDD